MITASVAAGPSVPVRFRFSLHEKGPWVGLPEVLNFGRGAAVSAVVPDGKRVAVDRAYSSYPVFVSVQSRKKGWTTIGVIKRREPFLVERAGTMLAFPGLEELPR